MAEARIEKPGKPSKKAGQHRKRTDSEVNPDLFQMGKRLLAESNTDRLLNLAMDQLVEISGAERGLIILFNEDGEDFQTARNLDKKDLENPDFEISHTIISRVRSTGESLCLMNALEDESLKQSASVDRLKILSVICLPLKMEGKLFGVIYLDNRTVTGAFETETNAFVQEFADFISMAAYRALERKQLADHVSELEKRLRSEYNFQAIVGHAPGMVEILQIVSQVADTQATVLIEGETGTGKELVARAIHFNSLRKNRPLVNVNCGAIPENLLESELFGHEKGAFTGAYRDHKGKFEQADGGTIFLDEVDEMSPALQVKVLRILQWGEFSAIGSDEVRQCDVRIIAASKTDLKKRVEAGTFRDDLYYRLNLIRITIPPLRERRDDIPMLAAYFLDEACKQLSKGPFELSEDFLAVLLQYDFPGNVRELENIIRRAAIMSKTSKIDMDLLPPEIKEKTTQDDPSGIPFQEAKKDFERQYFEKMLKENDGSIRRAAKQAGMYPKNFYDKLTRYGLRSKNPQKSSEK